MAIEVYINFNGNCREAVEFYSKAFRTEPPRIMAFGDAPPNPEHPIPEEAKSLVMHTELLLSGSRVMFSDVFPGMPFVEGNNVSLSVNSYNVEEIKTAFAHLKEGGQVEMDLQQTFWSDCYGSLVDKFGTRWQFSLQGKEM
ncbi:MAG: glyoxalase family protein [Paenibacillaceae bacterium]|jgi:PhnB protein|nr:glyoxalase family protein [Paenibacillaceae bacterium]